MDISCCKMRKSQGVGRRVKRQDIIITLTFTEKKFVECVDRREYSGNIEDVSTKEKSKFPQEFFPEVGKQRMVLSQAGEMMFICSTDLSFSLSLSYSHRPML